MTNCVLTESLFFLNALSIVSGSFLANRAKEDEAHRKKEKGEWFERTKQESDMLQKRKRINELENTKDSMLVGLSHE